jgi:hypothetical protein
MPKPTLWPDNSAYISPAAAGEEIEQRPENQSDVPAIGKALDQAEEEARPGEPGESRQELQLGLV